MRRRLGLSWFDRCDSCGLRILWPVYNTVGGRNWHIGCTPERVKIPSLVSSAEVAGLVGFQAEADPGTGPEPEPWHDALYEVAYDWWRWEHSSNPLDAASCLVKLANSMSDLLSWHPAWDIETGTWPWEREEDDEA